MYSLDFVFADVRVHFWVIVSHAPVVPQSTFLESLFDCVYLNISHYHQSYILMKYIIIKYKILPNGSSSLIRRAIPAIGKGTGRDYLQSCGVAGKHGAPATQNKGQERGGRQGGRQEVYQSSVGKLPRAAKESISSCLFDFCTPHFISSLIRNPCLPKIRLKGPTFNQQKKQQVTRMGCSEQR